MQTTATIKQKETDYVPNMIGEVKKPQIAKILACSPRQVDNYLADGMPHHKPSARKVTFNADEVLKWYRARYCVQRRKPIKSKDFSEN